jgi:hypothetical protein
MIKKAQLALIAAVAAFAIASPALAQSDYTSGTEASDVRAGYPSPYGHRHRRGLHLYAPGIRATLVSVHQPLSTRQARCCSWPKWQLGCDC